MDDFSSVAVGKKISTCYYKQYIILPSIYYRSFEALKVAGCIFLEFFTSTSSSYAYTSNGYLLKISSGRCSLIQEISENILLIEKELRSALKTSPLVHVIERLTSENTTHTFL